MEKVKSFLNRHVTVLDTPIHIRSVLYYDNNMKKFLIISMLLFIITGCTEQKGEDTKVERHLVEAIYSYGGGELGDHEEVRMEILNDSKVRITHSKKETFNSPEKTKKKTLSREAIENLEAWLEQTDFCLIPEKDYESWQILDGSTGWYCVRYSDGDSFSFSSTLDMDDADWETCKIFRQYLYDLIETGKIPELP